MSCSSLLLAVIIKALHVRLFLFENGGLESGVPVEQLVVIKMWFARASLFVCIGAKITTRQERVSLPDIAHVGSILSLLASNWCHL